ncbi:MAG TPA: NADH-ubiquinone oxidoreductase-F iron-sulfur binding region domain-containing protein [Thermoleophilia bacterium]|nr:NADH-ubiquinone oxidoreductase-F iron-sulfur binding region domain-containing protein [Thermoleophilia bacterium]
MPSLALERRRRRAERRWAALTRGPRPVVYVGMGSCGLAAGAAGVEAAVREHCEARGLDAEVVRVGCIGPCYLEPLLDVRLPSGPRVSYANMTPDLVAPTIDGLLAGEVPRRHLLGLLDPDHGREPGDGDGRRDGVASRDADGPAPSLDVPALVDHPMLDGQERVVLRNCGIIDPEQLDHYLARDGYRALEAVLELPWRNVIETVRAAGLRGRGGGGFPTWQKWLLCRQAVGDQRYLICNADEGDPGAFMNRSLVEGDPHAVLEGMLIAAYAIGASRGIVYIRAEYPLAIARLRSAIAALRRAGMLGDDILGAGFSFEIAVKEGAGAFVCGEETALIASIEGRRGMPRTRPPYPAVSGLFGRPTIINNVETLATLPAVFRRGAEWYAAHGTERSRGTKTFSLVGKVRRTGLIEVPFGTTLRTVIEDIGGGVARDFKAVQTGGPSGGCLGEEFLDTPIEYETLAAAGSIIGSGGLIVLDRDTCIVDTARYFLGFTQAESCGKCVPCRIGTGQLVAILDRICQGKGELADLDRLERLGRVVKASSLCGLGQTAPNAVLSSLKYFRAEFVEHIVEKRCRAAVCRDLVEYRIIPGRCTGCQRCVQVCPTGAITGPRAEAHNLDPEKCIKCRSCYEVCRFDAIAGDAIVIESGAGVAS